MTHEPSTNPHYAQLLYSALPLAPYAAGWEPSRYCAVGDVAFTCTQRDPSSVFAYRTVSVSLTDPHKPTAAFGYVDIAVSEAQTVEGIYRVGPRRLGAGVHFTFDPSTVTEDELRVLIEGAYLRAQAALPTLEG